MSRLGSGLLGLCFYLVGWSASAISADTNIDSTPHWIDHPAVPGPDDTVLHSMLRIGDTNLMLADAFPGTWERGPDGASTAGLWIYVEDCDALFKRAVDAGCEVLMPMEDAFWGDRHGKVKDPFGHCWAIASHKWVYSPEEMAERQAQAMG